MKSIVARASLVAILLAALPALAWAAEPAKNAPEKKTAKAPAKIPADAVELFAAMESGDIEVKVIPKDATKGTVTVKNNTDKPLTIKVPAALAGVPVLAQGLGGCPIGGGGGRCRGGGGNNNQNQGFGGGMMGGMGGMMGGMGGMGMGGGFFSVAPDKVAKLKLVTVCLDHGKDDPNPHVEYKLVPIESYATDPAIEELIKLMVAGKIDQHSAQAAAWHLQNGLTWEELATKVGAKHLDGSLEPYFTAVHLQRALAATKEAQRRAAGPSDKPGSSIGQELAGQ